MLDKSTLSMVVVVGGLLTRESQARGVQLGRTMPEGISLCIRCCWISSPTETCSSCKSFNSSFVHIEFQSPRCLLSLKGRTLSYLCKSHLACLRPHQRCPCDTRRGANPRVPTLLKVENCSYTFLGGELFLVHVGLFLHAAN